MTLTPAQRKKYKLVRIARWEAGDRPKCNRCLVATVSRCRWISTRRLICSNCFGRERRKTRASRWDSGERPICRNHPDRIVSPSRWKITGKRLCASCLRRNFPHIRKQRERYVKRRILSGDNAFYQRSRRLRLRIEANKI